MARAFVLNGMVPFLSGFWTGNTTKLSKGYKEPCPDNICFRMSNGTAVGVASSVVEDLQPNSWHFSKDVIETGFTSFLLPKRSPLQVHVRLSWR